MKPSTLKVSNNPVFLSQSLKRFGAIFSAASIALTLWVSPAQADPFRRTSSRQVGDKAEEAFRAWFQQGNYNEAKQLLQQAEASEPLTHAMRASLAYLDGNIEALGSNATQTRQTAEQLVTSDPLRGNMYIAVGYFLEGAYTWAKNGTLQAAPTVLGIFQKVLDHLGKAEQIAPNDPELNLLKGYMDIMLAQYLPFADRNQAIARLQQHGGPSYLVQRGVAIAYRDLRQYDQALSAVNAALNETTNNPDLLYLKAQILVRQGKDRESLEFFQQALTQESQLPRTIRNQLAWEQCRANNRVNNVQDDASRQTCRPLLNRT
jgi:tetratricopeptide (TPR) repeat protein